jgi:tRNA G10  N-methylase Trm11
MRFIIFVGTGNSLADAEVKTKLPGVTLLYPFTYEFRLESQDEAIDIVSKLGCSLKLLAEVSNIGIEAENIAPLITSKNFSVSVLNSTEKSEEIQFKIKEQLSKGRFVNSKDKFGLSPIVVTKQKVEEIFIDKDTNTLLKTIWVHDFQHWIDKDRHMPRINAKAGMLPPKIARSMINLLPIKDPKGKVLMDPFCGSGRVLVEAAELGFEVKGTDILAEQVEDTQRNLKFLGFESDVRVYDATHISEKFTDIDAIVTEPFLGKPNLRPDQSRYVTSGLEKLYLGALKEWQKVLKPGAYVVMVFPILPGVKTEYRTSKVIDDKHLLGYNQLTRGLVYSRPDADIKREIVILQKQ